MMKTSMAEPPQPDGRSLTRIQQWGGCAMLLGFALGIVAATINGAVRAGEGHLRDDRDWDVARALFGVAAVLGVGGMAALLSKTKLVRDESPPKGWRQACIEAQAPALGYSLAFVVMRFLNRYPTPALLWVGYPCAMYAICVLVRRLPLRRYNRIWDPTSSETEVS